MTGTRSSFVLLVILASHAIPLSHAEATSAQAEERSAADLTLRQRAEDLARAASQRFSEILAGEQRPNAAQGSDAEADPLAPVWNWFGEADRTYQGVIIAKFKNPSGAVAILAPPGTPAPQLPTLPAAAEAVREPEPRLGWTYIVETMREWLARANRLYRTEIVRRLQHPRPAEPLEATGQAPEAAQPTTPAPQPIAPAPQADAAGGTTATAPEPKGEAKVETEAKPSPSAGAQPKDEAEAKGEEAEAKREAEAEAKREAEDKAEAQRKAEAETKRKAETEAKREAEAEAKRKAEAEAEAKRKAEAEAKRKAEAEAEAKRKAEAKAEAKRKAEAEAKRKAEAEAEAKRKAEVEAKRKAEAEVEAKRKAEAEAEAKRLAAEADAEQKAVAQAKRLAEALPAPPEKKSPATDEATPMAPQETVVSEAPPPQAEPKTELVAKVRYKKKRLHRRGGLARHAHVPRQHVCKCKRHRHAKVHGYRYREADAWSGRVYVVRRGDSLSKIARRYYGSAAGYPAIYRANRHKIRNPNLIYPRQRLHIPSRWR
jgi:nucleoid-associated protein YgaU